jgi:hypothetical protein
VKKAEVDLFAVMIEWSHEVGFDYWEMLSHGNGIPLFQWWEKIVSCMTLEDVLLFLVLPEYPGAKENSLSRKMREIAIAHRDRLIQADREGAELHAKSEQCVG